MVARQILLNVRPAEEFKTFGEWIADVCADRPRARKALAEIAGVSTTTIGNWINGKLKGKKRISVQPSADAVLKLADHFRVGRASLLKLAGYAPSETDVTAETATPIPSALSAHSETEEMQREWNLLIARPELADFRRAIINNMRTINDLFVGPVEVRRMRGSR